MHLCERYHLFSGWENWWVSSGQIGGCRVGKLVGVEWANWWVSKWAKEEFGHVAFTLSNSNSFVYFPVRERGGRSEHF